MKPLLPLLSTAFCVASAAAVAPARADVDRAAVLALSASLVQVEVPRPQGGFALGTGVVVAAERVVTSCHVTREGREIRVVRGDARWVVSAQGADLYHDLCVLQVPGLRAEPVRLGRTAALAIGQSVTALGYTGGIGLQANGGEVLALHRMDGERVVRSSNFFSSGASGGGLFDDDLRLVGILTFRLRGGEAHYFAAPTEWLLRQLDAPLHDVAPADAATLAFWQRPPDLQPAFLRAQVLERDHDWAALVPLATAWIRADAHDAEAWYFLGVAQAQLDRPAEARRAFECSLAAEPGYAASRMRLAPLPRPADAAPRPAACAVDPR